MIKCGHLSCGSLELIGGVVKVGWKTHQHNLDDYSLHWPYLLPQCPLPAYLFYEEMDICHYTQDAECKLHDHFHKGSNWVFKLPELWNLPLPQQMRGMGKNASGSGRTLSWARNWRRGPDPRISSWRALDDG